MHGSRMLWAAAWVAASGCEKPADVVSLPVNLQQWRLSANPLLRIGDEANPETRFASVRAAVRLSSGEIVVLSGYELRAFSPAGAFLRRMSQRGEGPGDLDGLVELTRLGDTLFVVQQPPGVSQAHVFTVPNGFVRRDALRGDDATPGVVATARFASGEYFVTAAMPRRPFGRVEPGAMMRDSARMGILDAGGAGGVKWLGTYEVQTLFWHPTRPPVPIDGSSRPGLRGPVLMTSTYELGPLCVRAVAGDRVWIGDSGTGEISIYDASATRVGRFNMPLPARGFDMAALERAKERAIAEAPRFRGRYEWLYAKSLLPETVPFFSRFIPGADGEMWIERFSEDVRADKRMLVFDRDGRPIAEIGLPASLEVFEIGRDNVLGGETDSGGRRRVVLYELETVVQNGKERAK